VALFTTDGTGEDARAAGAALHAERRRPQRRPAVRQQHAEGRHHRLVFDVAGYFKARGWRCPCRTSSTAWRWISVWRTPTSTTRAAGEPVVVLDLSLD
jgi:hypothetical protein